MTHFLDLGGNGKGADLSTRREPLHKKKVGSTSTGGGTVTVPLPPPPPVVGPYRQYAVLLRGM